MSVDDGLRPLFRKHIPQFFWTSIETGGTGRGIPDSHYLVTGGAAGWIEFKATDGHAVTLTEFQVGWLTRYARMGGRAHVAVRRRHGGGPRRGPPVDELHVLPGGLALQARQGGLRDPAVLAAAATWRGGPARWDWDAVAALLAG